VRSKTHYGFQGGERVECGVGGRREKREGSKKWPEGGWRCEDRGRTEKGKGRRKVGNTMILGQGDSCCCRRKDFMKRIE
jgi:hypothetical protein